MGGYLSSLQPPANPQGSPSAAKADTSKDVSKNLEIIVLGTGAGITYVYTQQSSSAFVVLKGGEPVLLCDVGYGVTSSCMQHVGKVPPHIYVSHNHGDHSGELPVVVAVEGKAAAAAGRPLPQVLSHPEVMAELLQYRLRELRSTGKPLEAFASFTEVPSGATTAVGDTGLSVRPFRTRHSETCYGLVVYDGDQPVLGWTADSGFDEDLYGHIAEAAVLLVDARANGSEEHAGFSELDRLMALPYMQDKTVYITGYGTQDEAPVPNRVAVAHPGLRIQL